MNERKTPETDARLLTVAQRVYPNYIREMVYADVARQLERERDELRELYALDTQCLRAERDEARYAETDEWRALRKDRDGLQMQVDNLRQQNAELRDALRVRIGFGVSFDDAIPCPDCCIFTGPHDETCRHYATEKAVMQ